MQEEGMMGGSVTHGAGEAMGLEVMLFADKEKYFLTSAFFEGFKVSLFVKLMWIIIFYWNWQP